MASTSFFTTASLILAAGLLAACGGTVSSSTGGDGGAGGGSGGTSSSTGGTTASTGGSGGNTGGTGGSGGIGGFGGAGDCAALDLVGCLGAYPECVPVYDDTCCPSCDPGPCADCVSLQFHHCAPKADVCGDTPVPCGTVPDWACAGGQAQCGDVDPQSSPDLCGSVAGCIPGYCNLDIDCDTDPVCVPVTAGSCGPVLCDAIPPPCPDGTTNEIQNDCYTTLCIPSNICKPTL